MTQVSQHILVHDHKNDPSRIRIRHSGVQIQVSGSERNNLRSYNTLGSTYRDRSRDSVALRSPCVRAPRDSSRLATILANLNTKGLSTIVTDSRSRRPGFVPNSIEMGLETSPQGQCCGSGMFIPDPNFSVPDPGSKRFRFPDPRQRI